MTTHFESLVNNIQKRFEAFDEFPIVWDNAPDPRLEADADSGVNPLRTWIRLTVLVGEANQTQLGTVKVFRTVGVMTAQIFTILGIGNAEGYQIADRIADLFRSVSADGVVYRTPTVQNIGRTNDWWQINVSCPFYSDLTIEE